MKLEIDIPEHHYNNIMALDSVSLGRVPYKGIIMYSINAIKHGKVLDQEPTTKNCESCRYYGSHHEVCNYCYKCSLWTEGEPTTKNNLSSELEKTRKKLEKDFGELDCISREQALVAIRNLYPGMPRVDFNGSLRKWVDKYKPYIECDDAIKQLPSVTPQEPFKPMVEIDLYSVIKQKYIEREVLEKIRAEIKQTTSRYSISRERGGMGQVEWSDNLIKESEVLEIIDKYKAETEET